MERRPDVEALLPAVGAGELAVDEDRAAGILAAGRLRIGRNDAVGDGLDRAAFRAGEEQPRARLRRNRRIAGVRLPGKMIKDDGSAPRQAAEQGKRGTSQQVPTT